MTNELDAIYNEWSIYERNNIQVIETNQVLRNSGVIMNAFHLFIMYFVLQTKYEQCVKRKIRKEEKTLLFLKMCCIFLKICIFLKNNS